MYPITCSGIGLGNEAGAERQRSCARVVFEATEGWDVERELAFADSDVDRPHFTGPGYTDLASGAAVGPREGFALAENAIGNTARNGFIHVDPATFMAGVAFYLFEPQGGVMKTQRGTTVIIGDGYIGATPVLP